MTERLKPRDAADLLHLVQDALEKGQPMELLAGASKRGFGRPVAAPRVLDLSGLSGVVNYEPSELVLTARPGTPLIEIEALLAAQGQMLAFEPPDWGPLYGVGTGKGTLGGALSCNLSGSRRFKAGAARDHLLGFSCVTGRGEAIKAGGRVVKNVTGYDLCKLLSGSFGTLAALFEVTIKVLPRPEVSETTIVFDLSAADALALFSQLRQGTLEATGLAFQPATFSAQHRSMTLIRLEGPKPSVTYRRDRLLALLPKGKESTQSQDDGDLWRQVSALGGLSGGAYGQNPLWRIVLPPSAASSILDDAATVKLESSLIDWGGGLLYLVEPMEPLGESDWLRARVQAAGGHATLLRAGDNRRAEQGVFQMPSPPLAALTRRVKEAFDPKGLFNPGRIYADA